MPHCWKSRVVALFCYYALQVILLGDEKDCKTLNDALEPQETPYRGIDSILATEGTDFTTPKYNWKSQTAVLLPSGGTTGFPKAIQLSHFALIANGMQMRFGFSIYNNDHHLLF